METPSEPAKKSEKTPLDEFMLSEYATIASAHFELHNGLRQSFRFYLGIVALPVTVAAVVLKDKVAPATNVQPAANPWTVLHELPPVLVLVLGATAIVGSLLYVAMVNTRFDIVLYTRTVNATRGYFLSRAKELGAEQFGPNLCLPTDRHIPSYRERFRADWWSFMMMAFVNGAYAYLAMRNIWSSGTALLGTVSFAGLHVAAYEILAARRERQPIAGMSKWRA